jgi:sec-independent protein translocase protein TatA
MLPSLGPAELIIVLVIILILFGVGRLPEVGKALGQGIREFKQGARPEEEGERRPAEH